MHQAMSANLVTIDCVFLLSELSKWLEPLEKVRFEMGSIPTLIDYIKQVQISCPLPIYSAEGSQHFSLSNFIFHPLV